MEIRWWNLLKAVPEVKDAVAPVGVTKDWMASKSIWYQLIKAGVTLATAVGLSVVLSDQQIQVISASIAVAIPAICTVADAVVAIWLRLRTGTAIAGSMGEKKLLEMGSPSPDEVKNSPQQSDVSGVSS